MRLLRANLRKLIRRPATWVTFLLLVGLLALIFLAIVVSTQQTEDRESALAARLVVTFPGAYLAILGIVFGIGGLLAVTYGGAIGGSEWTWGTLKAAVARGESRTRYTVLGYLGVAVFAVVGMIAAFLVGVLFAAIGALLLNVPMSGIADGGAIRDLLPVFGRAGLALSMDVALGFAIATIARSQLAGIAVGIGVYFAEGIAGLFLPDVVKWFPFAAASAVVAGGSNVVVTGGSSGGPASVRLDGDVAVIVCAAWLLGSLVVASLWTERAEISG